MADLPPTDTTNVADPHVESTPAITEDGGAPFEDGRAHANPSGMSTPAPSTAALPAPEHDPDPSNLSRTEMAAYFTEQLDAMKDELNAQFNLRVNDIHQAHNRQIALLNLQHQEHIAHAA
jgi:hypothetical protein